MYAGKQRLFDYSGLEAELDQESVLTLARLFCDDTAPILAQIEEAVRKRNSEQVRTLIHMLKGCCRSINALSVEQFCEAIEDAAMRSDWTSISMGTASLSPLYEKLIEEVATYLEQRSS
jgi:HPt (histidine-containing phosphotransfer) domain-containing protein